MHRRYSDNEIRTFIEQTIEDSFCILPGHFPKEKLQMWNETFRPLLDEHIAREGDLQNRGPQRFYVTLPFMAPFADEEIFADPDILAIVNGLVGDDFTMVQLATDTPLKGSDFQEVHRDAPPLFPEAGFESPPFQLAVNFALVEVRTENGPFEVTRRTHMMSKAEGLARIGSGDVKLEPICMQLGDVMIRDVRHLHRGTPNRTDEPRPMVVIGYSRKWLFRPEVSIRIPRDVWETLSPASRHMLRYNDIVDSLDEALPEQEVYQAFAY
jgi:hypothetical protein